MIIPALKAKAKKQGLAFVTSPEKNLEEKHDPDAQEKTRPAEHADPQAKPVQPSAVCDNRSFAEVTRVMAAAKLETAVAAGEGEGSPLSPAGDDICTPGSELSSQTNLWQQQETSTSSAWRQAIIADLQQAPRSPAPGTHSRLIGPLLSSSPAPKKTQELLSSEEMQAIIGSSHSTVQASRGMESPLAAITNTTQEAQVHMGTANGTVHMESMDNQVLDFSKDPVIEMQRSNKHLGPVTCPIKVHPLLPVYFGILL